MNTIDTTKEPESDYWRKRGNKTARYAAVCGFASKDQLDKVRGWRWNQVTRFFRRVIEGSKDA